MAGVYIHIPFCKSRCKYCDFFSTTMLDRREEYVAALLQEIDLRKEEIKREPIHTIYFGGGTPSLLEVKDIDTILKQLSIIHYPLSIRLLAAGAVNGLISMLVLAANNLRDIEDDRPVGKRTIPVRFGKRAGELLVLLEVLLMPLLSYFAFGWSLPMILLFPALYWFHGILHATGSTYNRYLALAGKLNVLYTLLVFLQLLLF